MTYDRVILICTVAIAVIYLWASTQIPTLEIGDPLGPKAFPRLLGVALLLAAGLFGYELWKDRAKKAPAASAPVFDRQVMPVLAAVVAWRTMTRWPIGRVYLRPGGGALSCARPCPTLRTEPR